MQRALEQRLHERPQLLAIEGAQHGLHRADGRGHHGHRGEPHADEAHGLQRAAAQLAAERHGLVVLSRLLDDQPHGAKCCGAQRIITPGKLGVAAVGGEEELHKIVGPNRSEVDERQQMVELPEQRRDLDHGAELQRRRQLVAALEKMLLLEFHHLDGAPVFLDVGDHREHDLHRLAFRRHHQRAQLQAEKGRTIKRHADRTPAKGRVLLLGLAKIGQHLVGPDVQRAEGDGLALRLLDDGAVVAHLLREPREAAGQHELQLGAIEANAVGA